MSELGAMFTERPYVVAFLVSFLVIAWAERGGRRALFWLVSGTLLGWLMELSSTHNGFPFGNYDYHEATFADELSLGGVPIFASLSFAFLTYFGYSIACTFLSRLERRGRELRRVPDPRIEGSIRVLLLAALITTWADAVVDPVAHLGRYWFLGDLYHYETSGVHFDVPLTNYAGWFFTSVCVVLANQLFDLALRAREGPAELGFALPLKPLWALGSFFGDCAFMIGVTVYLLGADGVPSSEPIGALLASGVALTLAFAAFAFVMVRRGLIERARDAPAGALAAAAPEP